MTSRLSVFAILVFLASMASSFSVRPDRHTSRLPSVVASRQAHTLKALQVNGQDRMRNMFNEYDKPIVLLGCSSQASELYGVALGLTTRYFAGSNVDNVIQPAENIQDLVESIDSKRYKWPNILVLDFGDAQMEAADTSGREDLEARWRDVAASLYANGLLSVYVNVDAVGSKMDKDTAERKDRLDDFFVEHSDYEVCIRDEGVDTVTDDWTHIEWELARVLARARLIPAKPGDNGLSRFANTAHLTMGDHTFFLSLSFPDIRYVEPYVEQMCQDVDAMEYRTDLLECRDSRFDLLYGMQLLRRYCRPHAVRIPALPFAGDVLDDVMPIVYTVRTQHQAGTYPDDDKGIERMFQMLQWGLRAGVEVLDVESAWDPFETDKLLRLAEERYSSQILGSHHVVGKEVSLEDSVLLFEQCALQGRAHGAKVVLSIESENRDRMAYEAALIASELASSEGRPVIPNISLILGDVGRFSRVINLPFTPVTHQSLPFKAAPGQMTASEIMTTRLLTKIFQPKKFAILGHNIAYSVSPQMHGSGFAATKLPHEYVRVDVATVEEFVESDFFRSDDFGGTSVTIPHKQAIMRYVDVLSDSAREIGSVNTVVVKEEFRDDNFKRVVYGDNTDWYGMLNPLSRLLGRATMTNGYALIVGAGGTARAAAYVAARLGLKRIFYNRTPEKAQELADAFGGTVVTSLDSGEGTTKPSNLGGVLSDDPASPLHVVISTLPVAAKFTLPAWIFDDKSQLPIIFDVNYKPYTTDLLRQAESMGCPVVRGSAMLVEQGLYQFSSWTGRTAPFRVMREVVLQNCVEPVTTGTSGDIVLPVGEFD